MEGGQTSRGGKRKGELLMGGLVGWPTCAARDWKSGVCQQELTNARPLSEVAMLAGWPTPQEDNANNAYGHKGTSFSDLPTTAQMAGWATPGSSDSKGDTYETTETRRTELRKQAHGIDMKSCPAGTEKRGALNPDHSRWLMGFPAAWGSCGATAMQSSRKSGRRS
jgi:hypothetical protein